MCHYRIWALQKRRQLICHSPERRQLICHNSRFLQASKLRDAIAKVPAIHKLQLDDTNLSRRHLISHCTMFLCIVTD